MKTRNSKNIERLTIEELFDSGSLFRIPLYQRNFSWGEAEISQLIRDVADFASKKKEEDYYLGILVLHTNGKQYLEVVDGQQRLTVLFLLMMAFKNEGFVDDSLPKDVVLDIEFAHRPKAQHTLEAIASDVLIDLENRKTHEEIAYIYKEIPQLLNRELSNAGCTHDEFYDYLCENVILYQSLLPSDTELNHYFEVMNNRGEQLEKQEILKSDLLSTVDEKFTGKQKERYKNAVNLIWEACSDMNRYVQYGFSPKEKNRENLFGKEWNSLDSCVWKEEFEEVSYILEKVKEESDGLGSNIQSILNGEVPDPKKPENEDKGPDRFQSVINFPNFLLQVLRLYQQRYDSSVREPDDFVSLDDKELISAFKQYTNQPNFVKQFSVLLLKTRFLFDQYVIKRQYTGDEDEWSLQKLRYYPDNSTASYVNSFSDNDQLNRQALMLLAMFHVSIPTQNYKHWLTAVLNYLLNQEELEAKQYITYLEKLARKFFYDRYMVADHEEPKRYENMVFLRPEEISEPRNTRINEGLLKYKEVKNNLVFNYLDYLIWKEKKDENERINKFEFKFRSSVEHFNPRNPREREALDEDLLNSFGNLCLLAHGRNSSFGNNSPLSKAFNTSAETPLDSLKLYLMMEEAKKNIRENDDEELPYGGWGPDEVVAHKIKMLEMYKSVL
ncbi:MAG: GmrSD restriction endonuclease domain-containing protein [Bacteroidota bacterium]